MFVRGDLLVTSASDLTAASYCEFAWLRRVDARLGREITVPADDDPMMARAGRLGDAHEERMLERYRAQFGPATDGEAGGVVEIARPATMDAAGLAERAEETLVALQGSADIVFQATFFEAEQRAAELPGDPTIAFLGFADFLARTADGAIEVQDTKLARKAKVTALLQLAAYAEQLERLGVPVADEGVLILGDGARSRHRIADVAPVFRERRRRLHEILLERARAVGVDGERASADAVAWGAPGVTACGRCEVCAPEIEATRDPLLIAGLRAAQRQRLVDAGLHTIDDVARALPEVAAGGLSIPGIAPAVLERLAWQASLQVQPAVDGKPPVQVVDAASLASIPEPNPGDLFFDFEGDPLYREPGDDEHARWGIDYLFGMVDSEDHFTPLWAHDLPAERQALIDFLALVAERRRRFPTMKIYHYAAYERTHLTSIAARHGVGEAEVDQLLREHVLVDLYPVVRRALRVGSRSYSIKKLEPLYMGDDLRDEDGVTSGAQSVSEYAEATAQLSSDDASERAEGQRRLDAIGDYNRYDCVSTRRLRDWLLGIADAHGVVPFPASEVLDGTGEPLTLSPLAASLAGFAEAAAARAADPDVPEADRAAARADRSAIALAASAIDYHQREQKAFWWAHFSRLVESIDDWADTRDVLVVDPAASRVVEDWHLPPRARVARRHVRLRGEYAPGSTPKADREANALYAYPGPFAKLGAAPGARADKLVKIIEVHDDGVTIEETLPRGVAEYTVLPEALAPGPPPPAGRQKDAIEEWGRGLVAALKNGDFPQDPVVDVLRRTPPRLREEGLVAPDSAAALAAVGGDEGFRSAGAVIASLRQLEHSVLAVQGPPGTGKTTLAARVIKQLVERDGWHIGVVAQSHQVVENLLAAVAKAGLDPAQIGKVPQRGADPAAIAESPYTALRGNGHLGFVREHRSAGRGSVTGGTAWDFSNADRFERGGLDLLVVDEAGQFSLAPTIAASVAAERLLLVGDPQQLPQVSQGSHPEPVDTSALGWVLDGHETIPEDLGYFLAESRRMRPELCDPVSELAYEGRLRAHPSASERVVIGAGEPGLHWHPVRHVGNSTHSAEEADEVVRIARAALGATITDHHGSRLLGEADLIVVAAYNAQVELVAEHLAAAGLGDVRVGTVDRFQGQEAAVAIVTLAASDADEIPRGLEFLLLRNRLNVAISRAQWAAHLVSSERLGGSLPSSAEGVAALSGYLRLTERGGVTGE
ncbi:MULTISPECIES: bifunctional RecB family nuclease/DEAD/DEAH box helicase [unclassified Leucobacter]|uniref:TM0106 family RecB-like putative nuclease n=1 Tax=unclassified Leucobacter TaxID=2621730 RepID=UPI00165E7431|nr:MULTISPECIES: bifunctional RecB family nuclease/DEAD/DEAH box helicase [unclassified Leucobacter]MBC9937074.1 TM0106 family RecB-like putative nuclease [Leucobacter sp. cx-87]